MSVIFCEKLYDKEFFLKSWEVIHLFKKTSNFIKPECASPCTQNAPTGPAFMSVPFLLRFRSRDSVVGLVTRLWTEWSGVRFLAGELDAEDFFPGAKTAGAWSWLLLSMFRLIECRCTSSPPVYLYGTHRGDFATPLCPLAVSYPFALICCTSYLPLGVSDCHACCMCDRLSVADLISLKALDTNFEIPLYAVFSSDFSFETSAYGVSFLFVAVPFPLTSPSSANIDSFEICLNRVIAGSGTPSNSEQANIPALSQTQIWWGIRQILCPLLYMFGLKFMLYIERRLRSFEGRYTFLRS